MDADEVHAVLAEAADAVARALERLDDWSLAGTREGQYRCDLAADEAVVGVLEAAGFGWLSEESGVEGADREIVVIVDPVDGSTNASQGIPWFATSLCAMDREGPLAARVVNLASGDTYVAARGAGAVRNGAALRPSRVVAMSEAMVALSGYPGVPLGWRQFRALGAAALDICSVAAGVVDAYIDCSTDAHGAWDYAAGMLICSEAGAGGAEALGRDLFVIDADARRTPVVAATDELLAEAVAARGRLE